MNSGERPWAVGRPRRRRCRRSGFQGVRSRHGAVAFRGTLTGRSRAVASLDRSFRMGSTHGVVNIESGYRNLMSRFRILGCSCAHVRQISCAQVSARRAWSSASPNFASQELVSRPRSWCGPSARKFRPPFQQQRQAQEGAPAFDTVLDEQALRDQMHDRRLPGTPFAPIPSLDCWAR